MGYTHYWDRQATMNADTFKRAVADCRLVCDRLCIPIGDGVGEGEPEFSDDKICFNGHKDSGSFSRDGSGLMWPDAKAQGVATVGETARSGAWFAGTVASQRCVDESGDGSYETFAIAREEAPHEDGLVFGCCKTNYRPYDLDVQCCLIVFKHHFGEAFNVSSDGEPDDWKEAQDVCTLALGYGFDFALGADDCAVKTVPTSAIKPEEHMTTKPHLTRTEETKAVKRALQAAGIKARVCHGRGTAYGWLEIWADNAQQQRERITAIAKAVTGRSGEYDGRIMVC